MPHSAEYGVLNSSHFSSSMRFCSFICSARANSAFQSYFSPYCSSVKAMASFSIWVE